MTSTRASRGTKRARLGVPGKGDVDHELHGLAAVHLEGGAEGRRATAGAQRACKPPMSPPWHAHTRPLRIPCMTAAYEKPVAPTCVCPYWPGQ
ncbi:hypothetical protein [Streptomyces sp. NBC_00503]|uniref:hypothetical protein n=1 Tax=Streptomyces sp. NBC_00503 TaxID=2903659 RepID=UPI002E80DEA3|nr:hypothetical protein [Streptomyces sp. NBC_00503]WUD84105.1 hypothetical protein OG490_28105 [Streptomyces sp. NBC_00503]